MTAILDGILNEIASVALLPRNDGDLMRSPDQVGGWQKTRKAGIFIEIASSFVSLTPRNDGGFFALSQWLREF